MNDVIASEWLKVRTVRSTLWLLAAMLVTLGFGCVVAILMAESWDGAPPGAKSGFEPADPSVVVLPFVMFCLAAFSGLNVTSEYGTGMIRTTLTTVPRRMRLFFGKAVVIGGAALATGLAFAFAALGAAGLIVGDRPRPIAPWPSVVDGIPDALAAAVTVTVVALVAYGLGTVIRSAAGTLVAMTGWMFVLPALALMLPAPWNVRVVEVLPLSLAPRLAGEAPVGAAVALAVYVVVALGAGAWTLSRRDA
ncbi:ABC transporter permease [Prauserella oleivorans]|uniref:ABC transporter permease n=1 Tax=Prauserella oleivorans TaxID=1478153 RepID=A0ABW5WJL8_9PSEU